jgi:hypothetical protein
LPVDHLLCLLVEYFLHKQVVLELVQQQAREAQDQMEYKLFQNCCIFTVVPAAEDQGELLQEDKREAQGERQAMDQAVVVVAAVSPAAQQAQAGAAAMDW